MQKLLKTKQAAELLGVCTKTLRRMVDDQRLTAMRTHPGRSGHLLFREEDLLAAVGITTDKQPASKRDTLDADT